ncbi:hypothetical protein RUM44_005775 [Polyplax serrata]|uniref:COMM domain-containing protein n=1 Tax=Polyplax serrata TaxID=468196 RepID=A0ABR1AY18_POLSC
MFENAIIEKSIKVINSIEEGKFPLLLSRIAQFLSGGGTTPKPFTSLEEDKLQSSLEITKLDVQILIDGLIELFKACAYTVIKPVILSEHLEKRLSMNAKKAEIFVQVWASSARAIVDNFKQKPYFPQLNHVSYLVTVEATSNSAAKEKIPKAQLQLGVVKDSKRREVNLEFSHEELYDFYKKLEQIQSQLDAFR